MTCTRYCWVCSTQTITAWNNQSNNSDNKRLEVGQTLKGIKMTVGKIVRKIWLILFFPWNNILCLLLLDCFLFWYRDHFPLEKARWGYRNVGVLCAKKDHTKLKAWNRQIPLKWHYANGQNPLFVNYYTFTDNLIYYQCLQNHCIVILSK